MPSKIQKINFISENFTFEGNPVSKASLRNKSDEWIDSFCTLHQEEFEEWLALPKMTTFLVLGVADDNMARQYECRGRTETDVFQNLIQDGIVIMDIADVRDAHWCPTCGQIVRGGPSGSLCADCQILRNK